jgi:CheY-like chemotaxis protein
MKSILLLEEDVEGREVLAKMLRQRGFRVTAAADEAGALAALDSGSPVDLLLTGATSRDRLEFLSVLRERWSSMPVVFLADHVGAGSGLPVLFGGFYVSPELNVYMNARPIEFYELDRLIRIMPSPRGGGYRANIRTA